MAKRTKDPYRTYKYDCPVCNKPITGKHKGDYPYHLHRTCYYRSKAKLYVLLFLLGIAIILTL